jgi:mannosyl-oligosaccharide alpha-1,2-mannosidase
LYLSDVKLPDVSVSFENNAGVDTGSGGSGVKVDTEDIWSDKGDDVHDHGLDVPSRPTPDRPKEQEDEHWALNEYGDSFRRQPLTPLHPDIAALPAPSTLFPEVGDIASFLQPPTYDPFPTSRLRDIISDPPADEHESNPDDYPHLPDDAFSRTWKKPEVWDGERGDVRKVQWEGFNTGREDTWETKKEKAVRQERREAVRRGFVYAWQKYKDHAWGE